MVREDIREFLRTIPKDVTVVAATKYVGIEEIKALHKAGIQDFAENRVDALLYKYWKAINLHSRWHFIGHLQRNKVDEVINRIHWLHSLDSVELAKLIDKKRITPLKCFIEVSVNGEPNKNGVPLCEVENFIYEVRRLRKVNIVGFMMMAKQGSTHEELIKQFSTLKLLRDAMEARFGMKFPYLSMGMSDDYQEAIQCGATHIRLGRILYNL